MKVFKYKVKSEGWSGEVELKVPSYKERMKMLQSMGLKNLQTEDVGTQIEFLGNLIEKLDEAVVSIDVKYGDNSFKSMEELEYIQEAQQLRSEIGSVLINGISLGKPSPQQ